MIVEREMIQSDLYGNIQLTQCGLRPGLTLNKTVPYNWMNSVKLLTDMLKTIPSQAKSRLLEGVETTGGIMVFLNNQLRASSYSFNYLFNLKEHKYIYG